MTYIEILGRRSEILKRNISHLMLKKNRCGLGGQESNLYQSMIKELHQNEYQLNAVRNQSN
ncbi:hypothetical protein SD71_03185 [Cohnella kolymensis]|uniref:Fur-regulated basic protein FbpA n=1 Tax=Cohnella kolymensis TaxID=1590652 RepID=A0ABR5A998_9BACL|nr:hypothetical protein SD71_03185 [Cohnella kolymensis]